MKNYCKNCNTIWQVWLEGNLCPKCKIELIDRTKNIEKKVVHCDDCDTELYDGYCPKCEHQFEQCSWCGAFLDGEGFGIDTCCQACKAD